MNDRQYKRLMRAFTVLWVSMLVVILVLLFLLLKPQKPPVINNYLTKKGDPGQSIVGPEGHSGPQGLAGIGLQGPAGTAGGTTVINNTTNVPVPGPQGNKGDSGAPGTDGAELQIRVDPSTCKLQSKYNEDDFWQNLAQLPTPCEVQ